MEKQIFWLLRWHTCTGVKPHIKLNVPIVFSLHAVNAQISVDDCCTNGQEWAGQRQDCAALQTTSDSQMCR